MEQQIPVRELNQHTSSVLDRVAEGHAVTITRDGRPVARIVPIAGRSLILDQWVAQGLATAPTAEGDFQMPPAPEHGGPVVDVAALLVRDREQERG